MEHTRRQMQSWIPTAHAMKGRKAEVKAKVQIVCKDTNNERSNCVQSYKCRGACKGNAISLSKSPVSATTVVCFFNSSSWLMLTFFELLPKNEDSDVGSRSDNIASTQPA